MWVTQDFQMCYNEPLYFKAAIQSPIKFCEMIERSHFKKQGAYMDNEEEKTGQSNPFEKLTAVEIWEKLYGKELDCKKNILEYIDAIKVLKKENASKAQLADTYKYIYDKIEAMKEEIKPNTMLFLKNSLKTQLGKYVKEKDPKPVNAFIEFFKLAYPKNYRRNDYTRVLMDINQLSEEQIWTTLVYINRECLNNELKLTGDQRKDIVDVIKKAVGRNNVKFNNKIKSLQNLVIELNISIENIGQAFSVKLK